MNLAREDRKQYYDKNAVERTFKAGDKVLVLALSKPNKLSVNLFGPGTIEKKIPKLIMLLSYPVGWLSLKYTM